MIYVTRNKEGQNKTRTCIFVFGLYARMTIFKILGILVLMSGVELALFLKMFWSAKGSYSFLNYVQMNNLWMICLGGFLLVTYVLCMAGTAYGSMTSYTFNRLPVDEKGIFFAQVLYNIFVYVVFAAVQVAVIFLMGSIWVKEADSLYSQELFLAFYQDTFLHSLFPMEDVLLWWRNICWLLALGVSGAEHVYLQRKGSKINASLIVLLAMMILFGRTSLVAVGNCIFTSFVALMIIVYVLGCNVFTKGDAYDE